MTNAAPTPPPVSNPARFSVYVALVLSVAMVLFPPFTSVNGTEYAFVLTGPEWARAMEAVGRELGLTARIDWALLLVQLGAVWAVALGAAVSFKGRPADAIN